MLFDFICHNEEKNLFFLETIILYSKVNKHKVFMQKSHEAFRKTSLRYQVIIHVEKSPILYLFLVFIRCNHVP